MLGGASVFEVVVEGTLTLRDLHTNNYIILYLKEGTFSSRKLKDDASKGPYVVFER